MLTVFGVNVCENIFVTNLWKIHLEMKIKFDDNAPLTVIFIGKWQ